MTGRELWRVLAARRGTSAWDAVLYGSGVVAALTIPLVLLVPEAARLAALLLIAILLHSPVSFVCQGCFESVLVWYGTVYPPVLVASVAVVGNLYIEAANYALFTAVRDLRMVDDALAAPRVGRMLARFQRTRVWAWCERRPFWMVLLTTASPIPDVFGRLGAVAQGYPMRPYLAAHFLGRFPRFWVWAWLGSSLRGGPRHFVIAAVVATLIGFAVFMAMSLWKKLPLYTRPRLPRDSDPQAPRLPA